MANYYPLTISVDGRLHYLLALDEQYGDMPLLAEYQAGGSYEDINIMATDDAGDRFITDLPSIRADEWHVENEVLVVNIRGHRIEVDFREIYQDLNDFGNYGHIEECDGIYFIDDAGPGYVVVRRNGYLYPIVWLNNGLWHPYVASGFNEETAFALVTDNGPVLYEDNTFYWATNAAMNVDESHGYTEEQINEDLRSVIDFDNSDIKGVVLTDDWDGDSEIDMNGAIPFFYGG